MQLLIDTHKNSQQPNFMFIHGVMMWEGLDYDNLFDWLRIT